MKIAPVFYVCFFLITACQTEKDDPVILINNPEKAQLVFPYENSECNEGTSITATTSTVLFEWEPADYTDQYELNIWDLITSDLSKHITENNKVPIVLERATPYAWYVISRSFQSDSLAESETWMFYNAGEGIQSYAPFPAEIVYPEMSEIITTPGNEVTLIWNGVDVDDDIVNYDIFFGTTNPPEKYASEVSESQLPRVPVELGIIYFWSIKTIDATGNSSSTGVYQFKVQ